MIYNEILGQNFADLTYDLEDILGIFCKVI